MGKVPQSFFIFKGIYNKHHFTHVHTTHVTKEELHITIITKPVQNSRMDYGKN